MGRLLDKVVFVSLLALIVTTAIPYGTVDPWWEALFECAVFGSTALWILEGLLSGDWRLNRFLPIVPLIILTVYSFLQTVQLPTWIVATGAHSAQRMLTVDQYQTHLTTLKILSLTAFLGLLLIHVSTPKRLTWLVRTLIAVGFGSAVFGITRQLLQAPTSSGFVLPFLFPGTGYGQFIGANGFSYLMEMSFGLIAGLVLGSGIPRTRVPVYVAAALVIWTALVLSNSRGGMVSLGFQFIFLLLVSTAWYLRRRRSRAGSRPGRALAFIERSLVVRLVAIAVIGCVLVAGVLWMGGERLTSKFQEQASSENTNTIDGITRRQIWRSTWSLIKDNPWTGVGFGAYFLAIPQYQIGSGRIKVAQAHNDYLDLLASGGLVAGLLAAWFIVLVFWRTRSSLRAADSYRRAAALGAVAAMLDVAIHSVVDFGLQFTGIAVFFMAVVTIAAVNLATSPRLGDNTGTAGST
jgi:O-antigen ligase